jgi:hypothetical protein
VARKRSAARKTDRIIIDAERGLEFASEEELYQHFFTEIKTLEDEYFKLRKADDVPEDQLYRFEANLNNLLEDPDEVWRDTGTMGGVEFSIYLKHFADRNLYHVAVVYLTQDTPSFVYLHFPTRDEELVARYRRGQKVFDRSQLQYRRGAIEGDALNEGDEFATGLYAAMTKLRSESDIPEAEFKEFSDYREDTIEHPDEIWRSTDSLGNVLVTFVKEYADEQHEDEDSSFHYVVVTLEDSVSNSHALLFSFPTQDENLLARYRQGENLQAEEVVQEASH